MWNPISVRRLVRHSMAILFAGLVTTYCVLWVVHVKRPTPQPGFSDYKYSAGAHSMTVGVVYSDSPAKEAGLRPGDRES